MTPLQLRAFRHSLFMSAEVFARLTGTATGRTVRRWERGDSPVPGAVVNLCRVLGWLDIDARNCAITHILLSSRPPAPKPPL